MRFLRPGHLLLALILGISCSAWSQGGRAGRAAATQQSGAPPAATTGRGGGGGAPPPAAAIGDFYSFDTNAGTTSAAPEGAPAESHQKISLNGETLAYTVRAGYMPLRNATTGQSEAHLFYTCYAKDGVSDSSTRPLIFFTGGAPGVAAAWQEFGGFGPKRMKWAADGTAGSAPYTWTDNPYTLLGQADLVFVNPVGTAFSRPDQPAHGPNFWNTSADVASLAAFVRSFIAANTRQNSAIFLAGEDYGTARVAGLADYLSQHEVPVRGVVLLSMAPSADSLAGDEEYITLLPSLVMAAWHHKKLSPDLNAMSAEQISGQARQFAGHEYLHALYKGDRMTPEERAKVIADLSKFTGVSKAFIANNDLRVTLDRFTSELMHAQHLGLASSDSRVTGFMPGAGGGGRGGRGGFGALPAIIDYNEVNLGGGLQNAYETYLRRELSFTGNANGIFYLSRGGTGAFTLVGSDDASLAGAFARNPKMRLFVGINYFDLKAPFYATEFTLAHLSVSPDVRAHNITVSHFEAGAMPYVDTKALTKLHAELARFVSEGANQ